MINRYIYHDIVLESNFIESNLTEKQRLPPGHWAEKLGELLSSLNAEEIVETGVKLDNAIAVFRGHVVRVGHLYL